MATKYEDIYIQFLNLIENDVKFFNHFNLTEEQEKELVKQRCSIYFKEAMAYLVMMCHPPIKLNSYNDDEQQLDVDLTGQEIFLIANLMKEQYYRRNMTSITIGQNHLAPKDLSKFSPAKDRESYLSTLQSMESYNLKLIDEYKSRDRLTGQLIQPILFNIGV